MSHSGISECNVAGLLMSTGKISLRNPRLRLLRLTHTQYGMLKPLDNYVQF